MARLIGTNSTIGITLSSSADNPVLVTATIDTTAGRALYGQSPIGWSITNQGTIETTDTQAAGILLQAGGSIDNAGSALISGGFNGVFLGAGAGTVTNAGTIQATGSGDGVLLQQGGSVSNADTGTIYGASVGVYAVPGAGTLTVTNAGTIAGAGGAGVALDGGGYVGNSAGGRINGSLDAVYLKNAIGTVINGGSIASSNYTAVDLRNGGFITNLSGGTLTAVTDAAYVKNAPGTVTNAGSIASSRDAAVGLDGGGYFSNASAGVISGYDDVLVFNQPGTIINAGTMLSSDSGTRAGGIYLGHGGTIINTGTIAATGSSAVAVGLAAGFASTVVVGPTASFTGTVASGNTIGSSIVSTLELAAGAGMLAGVGSGFVDFGAIQFDPGARWTIGGSTAGLAGGEAITGFAPGDTIELVGVDETIAGFSNGTLALTGSQALTVLLPGSTYAGSQFSATGNGVNTDITVACFCAGTRILTAAGEVAVERLEAGMRVVAGVARGLVEIRWMGWRRVDCARHPRPPSVSPVRVCSGAFGPGMPNRDLWLSPDHAVFVDAVLIPIRHLVNGSTIEQVQVDKVAYYHVELPGHDVIYAEGMPAESYLDTGNRRNFANGGKTVEQHPEFGTWRWEAECCAPLIVTGPRLQAARRRVNSIAAAMAALHARPAPLAASRGPLKFVARRNPVR